ncbi:hypothetical protein [Mesorhizobium sp. B3-1-6]|uniref:hypothetical protein n=1 Tax=Mesorhizobium sp. B3-1-6 TaxID=2589895 RepID=UPI00112A2988|nr:hypothetical protein [Mesorhizobium sp. B3-1-6]
MGIWTFVNSPFFLWLASASLITAAGSYLTNHRQCMADSMRLISEYNVLRSELNDRLQKVSQNSLNKGDADSFKAILDKVANDSKQYPGVSIDELFKRYVDYEIIIDGKSLKDYAEFASLRQQLHSEAATEKLLSSLNALNDTFNSFNEVSSTFRMTQKCDMKTVFEKYIYGAQVPIASIPKQKPPPPPSDPVVP